MATILNTRDVPLSPEDTDRARKAGESLSRALDRRRKVSLQVPAGKETEILVLPSAAAHLLADALQRIGAGRTVHLAPDEAEVTTQQAADQLNVSRPYVVKLIEEGALPSRKVGRFRRILQSDLAAFKRKDDAARKRVVDKLTAEAQELGMGY